LSTQHKYSICSPAAKHVLSSPRHPLLSKEKRKMEPILFHIIFGLLKSSIIIQLEDFNKPKVVYMEIQTDNPEEGYPFPCYSYDNKRCVVLNTAYIMSSETLDPRYVLGILNSRLGKFLVKLYVTQLQERQFRMLSQYVMKFPIARPTREQEKEMTHLVQDILVNKSIASENRIDELAFQIYKLSEQETKILISR